MKKRILALTLVLALSVAFAVPALMATPNNQPTDVTGNVTSITAKAYAAAAPTTIAGTAKIDDTLLLDTTGLKSYFFLKDGTTSGKVGWKDIADKDYLPDGKSIDVTKLISKKGTLFFSSLTKDGATYKDVASLTSLIKASPADGDYQMVTADGTIVAYTIGGDAGTKPSKPSLDFTKGTEAKDFITGLPADGSATLEWAFTGSTTWADLDKGETTLKVQPYKQDILIRTKATTTDGPSAAIKLSIPAAQAPPAIKFNISKGEFSGKAGYEVVASNESSIDASDPWDNEITNISKMKAKSIAVGAKATDTFETGKGTVIADAPAADSEYYVRVPATEKKPASPWVKVDFGAAAAVEPPDFDENEAPDYFGIDKKGVTVLGGAPIEMLKDGKWKKVKSFKISDLPTAKGSALEIRLGGTKYSLPSESTHIYWDTTDKEAKFADDKS